MAMLGTIWSASPSQAPVCNVRLVAEGFAGEEVVDVCHVLSYRAQSKSVKSVRTQYISAHSCGELGVRGLIAPVSTFIETSERPSSYK